MITLFPIVMVLLYEKEKKNPRPNTSCRVPVMLNILSIHEAPEYEKVVAQVYLF